MFRIAASVLVLSTLLVACVEMPNVYQVSRSFAVHVKNEVGPVAGLSLKVFHFRMDEFTKLTDEQRRAADPNSFEQVIAESVTDDNGTAHFTLDRTGKFSLSSDSPAPQTWVDLDVTEQLDSPVVEIQWPAQTILRTNQMRGKLVKGLFSSHSIPLGHNGLKLHSLVNYADVAELTTGNDGTFDFGTIAAGLYFLQIIPTRDKTADLYKSEGNIAIYITPQESRSSLSISVANTDCGLSYDLEENKARYKPESCFKGGKPVKCDY